MRNANLHELIDNIDFSHHLENLPFGVILWDHHLKIVYCSDLAAAIFCSSPYDLVVQQPRNFFHFVPPDDAGNAGALLHELTSGRATRSESLSRNLTKDGNLIYCQWYHSALKDSKGKVIQILSLVKEVTDQVQTQQALEKTKQQLSLAFNGAIDPMWLIRLEDGGQFRFETINSAFTKVTGWTPEQVEGQPIERVMPAASHDLVRQKYKEAIASGKIIDYIEEALHPAGIKYGEIRVIPIHGQGGEPARILGIANDITEKVHLQKKLDAEQEIRSRHITSAAIKGQESERAKVSRELHDNVNQVLTTVKLYIELCVDQKIDTADILPKCLVLLTDTINEIRNLSKQLSAPSLGNINFKESLKDLLEPVRAAAQMEVNVHFEHLSFKEMEDELHLTLYRVAQEQLTNIIKYAKANRVVVSLKEENAWLHFTIEDNGIGFDPAQKSNGIGITNMRSRIEILNGRFHLTSHPGDGTRVDVTIPVIIEDGVCYAEQTVLRPSLL